MNKLWQNITQKKSFCKWARFDIGKENKNFRAEEEKKLQMIIPLIAWRN